MRSASLRLLLLLSLPLLLAGPSCPHELRVGDRFEAVLPLDVQAANPFDPDEVRVRGEFRPPHGSVVTTPAFVYRSFAQARLPDGREQLTPEGDLEWRVRFTPTRPGRWRWRWVRETSAGVETGGWSSFVVGLPDRDWHGFLRRSERDDRHLVFDDGTPFFAVGENLAWYDHRGTFAYEDWMAKLAASGVGYVRLWMPSWAFGLVYAPAELDDWTERLDRAWQLDRVLELAERHGLRVMLSVQNHGPFDLDGFFGTEWNASLWNAANGGPLSEPSEFWADPEAREVFRDYLRYVVARWGHSATILCWELWNEADLAEQPATIDPVVDWHREMARHLRALDPNRHLVTTSTSDELMTFVSWLGNFPIEDYPLLFDPVWALPEIDFVQLHTYQIGATTFQLAANDFLATLVARMRQHGKPVLVAEAGVDFRGPAEALLADPDGHGFHDLLWAGVFSESFGTAMSWWWDNVVDPEDWYFHWSPIARLVDGVRFDREGFVRSVEPALHPDRPVEAQLLVGRRTVLGWVKNVDHQYWAPDLSPVDGARLTLSGLPPGRWRGHWIDPWSDDDLGSVSFRVRSASETIVLDVPSFAMDAGLRLDRSGWPRAPWR